MSELAPEFDPARGILRLSRAQLMRLLTLGPAVGPVQDLHELGLVHGAGRHPALDHLVSVVGAPVCRFHTRSWRHGRRTIVQGFLGAAGIVVVPVGSDADTVVDIRMFPRPGSLARALASVLDLPTAAHDPAVVLPAALAWDDVVAPALGRWPGWADGIGDDVDAFAVHDLRWSPTTNEQPLSVLALVQCDARLFDVQPVRGTDDHELIYRHPLEIWTALCRLTAEATALCQGVHSSASCSDE